MMNDTMIYPIPFIVKTVLESRGCVTTCWLVWHEHGTWRSHCYSAQPWTLICGSTQWRPLTLQHWRNGATQKCHASPKHLSVETLGLVLWLKCLVLLIQFMKPLESTVVDLTFFIFLQVSKLFAFQVTSSYQSVSSLTFVNEP